MAPSIAWLKKVRQALQAAADPRKAPAMQAYMKSSMPYHGVTSAVLRAVCKDTFRELQFASAQEWQQTVLDLWRPARFREERYAALYLIEDKRAAPYQTPAAMTLYEELIVSGAWWDYVDVIASHRVGPILKNYQTPMRRKMLTWSTSEHLWKRRTAIICQLQSKGDTDLDLLYTCIEPSLGSREFFLQKAIGWALRQYARTDAAEVRTYVHRNRERLSALSRREALKRCGQPLAGQAHLSTLCVPVVFAVNAGVR